MHTHKIIDLMNPMEHCPSCGALLVTVPGGAICAHCGFSDLEEPAEGAVVAFRKGAGRSLEGGFLMADDWPEDVFDEVA
ncbi:hypothetical protein ACFL2F_00035 [Myxococcota bacterium]